MVEHIIDFSVKNKIRFFFQGPRPGGYGGPPQMMPGGPQRTMPGMPGSHSGMAPHPYAGKNRP